MAKFKEFQLNGCISMNDEVDEDAFVDEFFDLLESKGWFYGGCIDGYREERKGRKEEDKT